MPDMMTPAGDITIQQCIGLCLDCHATCEATVTHCIDRGGAHAELEHLTLLRDCAQICLTSAGFLLRGSGNLTLICEACADVCERCAAACDGFELRDGVMTRCAQVCRDCARSCIRVLQ